MVVVLRWWGGWSPLVVLLVVQLVVVGMVGGGLIWGVFRRDFSSSFFSRVFFGWIFGSCPVLTQRA